MFAIPSHGELYAAVDVEQAARFLTGQFGPHVRDLVRIGHGEWSRAFSYRLGRKQFVIRFSAVDEDFAKDERVSQFRSTALPAPRMVARGEAFGGYFAITERVAGSYLDVLSGRRVRGILPSLFATLDAVREVDVSSSAGYGVWRADGNAPHPTWRSALLAAGDEQPGSRVHGWKARLLAFPERARAFEQAVAALSGLVHFCPEARHLIHSDLLHYNVLVRGRRVTALLDWGSALYGDFLYDIAWLSFWSPWYPAWRGVDVAAEARRHYAAISLEIPHVAERLRCYAIHIGLDGQAYSAFRGRWDDVDATARRTRAMIDAV